MAYSAAKSMSKEPEAFGTGSEEGVVASEAANNATIGGALIPLVAMGIRERYRCHSIRDSDSTWAATRRAAISEQSRCCLHDYLHHVNCQHRYVRDDGLECKVDLPTGDDSSSLPLAGRDCLLCGRVVRLE